MSSLGRQYERQARWRAWEEAISILPLSESQRVLDLGCGVGDVSALLQARGVEVIGVDADLDLLASARARHPAVRFEQQDVCDVSPTSFGMVDGIWSSFVAAYLPDLAAAVTQWTACIAPGGWLALVEVNDLLGHEPLAPSFREQVERFYAIASVEGRYDFLGGRKLARAVERAGCEVLHDGVLPDLELSFHGAAAPDVIEAWQLRFSRMGGLRSFFGTEFVDFERAFLDSLRSPMHRSICQVRLVVARRRHAQ